MGNAWSLQDDVRAVAARERGSRFREGGPRVALLYPSPYRAGMSSLGFQWILSLLEDAGFSVERAFLPDDPTAWKRTRRPLETLETGTPLGEFPIVGVSLAYEIELAGLVQALALAGIPPLAADRGPGHPRILLGGPITFSNPLPASPFADAMLLGEADDVVVAAVEASFGVSRGEWLDAIERVPGGFVPERHGVHLPALARASDAHLPARSRILAPDAELSDMLLLEGERGCHRACTFCVMRRTEGDRTTGMRLVAPDRVLSLIPDHARRVGLVGAAISDHPEIVGLVGAIVESGREVGISSLRADRVMRKPELARLLRKGGYQTLTVASDAASARLRKDIRKGTSEDHLVACAELAREHGYRCLKVYMMVGVPDEGDDDIDELCACTLRLARIHSVVLGVAPFVPKKNTPLDDAPFAGIRTVERRLHRLAAGLRGKAEVRAGSARWAWAEWRLAQGGPEAGLAVVRAVHAGGRFGDWHRELVADGDEPSAPWRAHPVPDLAAAP